MRKLHLFGTALFAVLALGALVGASTSSAAVTSAWLVNGKVTLTPVLVLSENVKALVLEDMGVPAAVECPAGSVLNEGWVGPLTEDETTSVTFLEPEALCKPVAKAENLKGELVANGCEKVKDVKAVNLPWLTELLLVGGIYLDDLYPGNGSKLPGYLVECKTLLGTVDDTCTEHSAGGSSVDIDTEASDVIALFNKEIAASETADCTVGGKENGLVIGEVLVEVMEGTLAVSETEEE